ncbi:MAG: pyridoxamine 5'-phosphate oxidase [Phycisphaerae bacterium]
MDKPVTGIRREHAHRGLIESEAAPDPLKQFDSWFDAAVKDGLPDPSAMALATVDTDGRPSVRMVLLKGFGPRGFIFYTNYESRKGRELTENPHVAACFWWDALDRQVRIEGNVEQLSPEESDTYFQTRPRESQLAAWASKQSVTLTDRAELERQFGELEARYNDAPVPRPPRWGGYRIRPTAIEFWQGRQQRLHDRLRYRRGEDGKWVLERLSP